MVYVIKHVLPGGEVACYHADSCCNMTSTSADAKRYEGSSSEKVSEQLAVVRRNFEYVWGLETSEFGGGPDFRNWDGWKGCSLEQIQTVAEIVS